MQMSAKALTSFFVLAMPSAISCRPLIQVERPHLFRIQGSWNGYSKPVTYTLNFIRPVKPGDSQRITPTPDYEFEFISVDKKSSKSPCQVQFGGGLIVGTTTRGIEILGENQECLWISEISIDKPMASYRIWYQGKVFVEQAISAKSISFER